MKHGPASGQPLALLLERVARLLDDGQAPQALGLLGSLPAGNPYVENARGVCLMRAGRVRDAIALYQGLAMHGSELSLDLTQPTAFLTNFATALLLDKNVQGCRSVLFEMRQDGHPSVVRLRGALDRWKKGLGWWNRFLFSVYGDVEQPIVLDFPPGELVIPNSSAPAGG